MGIVSDKHPYAQIFSLISMYREISESNIYGDERHLFLLAYDDGTFTEFLILP